VTPRGPANGATVSCCRGEIPVEFKEALGDAEEDALGDAEGACKWSDRQLLPCWNPC
jgi:hypothetical protein